MIEIEIKIYNKDGQERFAGKDIDELWLVYDQNYCEDDYLKIRVSEVPVHLKVQVDDALGQGLIYMTNNEFEYQIPWGEKKVPYSQRAFSGDRHLIMACVAEQHEINTYRNLALNVMDQHDILGVYPHASANVETRGEAVFAARNAIDGVRENKGHGEWPYTSWGINMQDDAAITIDFGRQVEVNRIKLYTRADFPHDNWWEEATLTFSDGSTIKWQLIKSHQAQVIDFDLKMIEWIRLENLIKSDDPSPFPALTQVEVYGSDV